MRAEFTATPATSTRGGARGGIDPSLEALGWDVRNVQGRGEHELIEGDRGTVSPPFEPGEQRRIAVEIVDGRGIESSK